MVSITKQQFENYLRQFVDISKNTSEPWEILQAPSPNSDYIYGSLVITKIVDRIIIPPYCENDLDENDFNVKGSDDPYSVPTPTDQLVVRLQYHIIYSESYSAPVLYFIASHSNGSLLGLEEIWMLIPPIYMNNSFKSNRERLEDSLSVISPTEHPYLGTPVYYIHPCQATTLLCNVFSDRSLTEEETTELNCTRYNIIVTWLSSVGPVIGVKLDPYYAVRLREIYNNKPIP